MSVLVLAEHNNIEIKAATYNTIFAASKIDSNVEVLLIGSGCEKIAKELSTCQYVQKVLLLDKPQFEHPIAELYAPVIVFLSENYTHIIGPATTFGKNILPRVAVNLDISQVSDVIKIIEGDTFVRPIYAGNALSTVRSNDSKKIITVRPTSFDPVSKEGGTGIVETISFDCSSSLVEFISREESSSERPELSSARVVISGGRGMQSAENFNMLNEIADKLNAAVGASRAAVDAGYVSNDYQVGQTGKVVAPKLYLAVGISGAIQHLAGMKDSQVIVVINNDPDAPMSRMADLVWQVDLFDALNELNAYQV